MLDVDLPFAFYRVAWWGWIVWFAVVETAAILDDKHGVTLTETVRPWFHAHPLTWFLAAGFIVWLFLHFLLPGVEAWLTDLRPERE